MATEARATQEAAPHVPAMTVMGPSKPSMPSAQRTSSERIRCSTTWYW